ncbi:MAG: enoyl-CoA hydratase-related protein [Myxococcota bacterium]|nr:enoyl-CoA hydratase-related protein [Myxococcota bacterium]
MALTTLQFETTDAGIGIIRLNRPEALNALNSTLVRELGELLESQQSAGLRALVLTGNGRAFAAGADISEMSDYTALKAAHFARIGQRALGMLEHFPAPTIAAVNGFALGGGCELAMCCDLILAAANTLDDKGRPRGGAVFGQPEVKLGVIPGFGGTQRLVRRVGRQRGLELMMTGRNVLAEEAAQLGLALRVEDGDVLEAALKLAGKIARNGPAAVALVKRAVHETDRLDIDAGLAAEASLFALCFATEDQSEGMSAFLEKRRAAFTGR